MRDLKGYKCLLLQASFFLIFLALSDQSRAATAPHLSFSQDYWGLYISKNNTVMEARRETAAIGFCSLIGVSRKPLPSLYFHLGDAPFIALDFDPENKLRISFMTPEPLDKPIVLTVGTSRFLAYPDPPEETYTRRAYPTHFLQSSEEMLKTFLEGGRKKESLQIMVQSAHKSASSQAKTYSFPLKGFETLLKTAQDLCGS
jgi:hypothetical protein